MIEAIEREVGPGYEFYLGCRDREQARTLFAEKHKREPLRVNPPDEKCPYWRVGPVDDGLAEESANN